MNPSTAGNWASLGIGVALIALFALSIFKLIGAWVTIAAERRKENEELKKENELLRKENNHLRAQVYGKGI